MEFSDISKDTPNTERHRNTHLYENTTVTVATIETDETKCTDQAERDEENYEQLNFDSKANNEKRDSKESTQNRTKYMIYAILAMLVLLYIAVLVLIVIVVLPKSQVNGGWSAWSSWASCSVSCDVGIQHRNRSCSNPYPSGTGHHCFGESEEDRICLAGACSDGGWSSWSSWGTCSATCDGGVRSQIRTCTNPKPSLLGKSCDGNAIQVSVCNMQACSDGAWGSLSSWSSCSAFCGGGIRSQTRACTNPKPSILGKYCDGATTEVSICNKQKCPEYKVAFTAYGISGEVRQLYSLKYFKTMAMGTIALLECFTAQTLEYITFHFNSRRIMSIKIQLVSSFVTFI
ncbi:semaphorin-5A-like [Mercenaria mercenaria]|uniref:semaphorin-5A-like n=1 Tax=Mercenaria mercenaria TaxID=6596 RepID=UPI00234EEEF9|nr:semaphorin-5A-like [Mercenaria mercenaria]